MAQVTVNSKAKCESFTLNDSLNVLPRTEFGSYEEKYCFVTGELNIIIEKMIREGRLDISKGMAQLTATKDSALSFLDKQIADQYEKETGWKIELHYTTNIVIEVPTYLYELELVDYMNQPIQNTQVNFYAVKGEKPIPVGYTNAIGIASIDLVNSLKNVGLHPYYLDSFIFNVAGFDFQIEKTQTDYKHLRIKVKLDRGEMAAAQAKAAANNIEETDGPAAIQA